MLVHLENGESLKELISKGVVLIDFFATWCGPCKMLSPELEALSNENSDITIIKVDVDRFPKEASEFNIHVVPTLFIFKDGINKKEMSGYKDKDTLLEIIRNV